MSVLRQSVHFSLPQKLNDINSCTTERLKSYPFPCCQLDLAICFDIANSRKSKNRIRNLNASRENVEELVQLM